MSARLARTADGWWAVTPAGLVRLDLPAATTAGLLADRAHLAAAVEACGPSDHHWEADSAFVHKRL